MTKYNIKKLLKGEKLWMFNEYDNTTKEEYLYITSDCVVIKTQHGTAFWLEANKDLKFEDWDARHNEDRVKEISHVLLESDVARDKATVSSIMLQEGKTIKRVMFINDGFKQINNKYIDVMNSWYNVKCETADNERGAFYFYGPEYEIAIMPMVNKIDRDAEKFADIVRG